MKRPKLALQDQAYMAAQWASGIKQRDIGAAFGGIPTATVCSAIERFIRKMLPDTQSRASRWPLATHLPGHQIAIQGDDRKALVKQALDKFRETDGSNRRT